MATSSALNAPDDDAAEGSVNHAFQKPATNDGETMGSTIGPERTKNRWSKQDRKEKRGANKARKFQKVRDETDLCWRMAEGRLCDIGDKFVL